MGHKRSLLCKENCDEINNMPCSITPFYKRIEGDWWGFWLAGGLIPFHLFRSPQNPHQTEQNLKILVRMDTWPPDSWWFTSLTNAAKLAVVLGWEPGTVRPLSINLVCRSNRVRLMGCVRGKGGGGAPTVQCSLLFLQPHTVTCFASFFFIFLFYYYSSDLVISCKYTRGFGSLAAAWPASCLTPTLLRQESDGPMQTRRRRSYTSCQTHMLLPPCRSYSRSLLII